MLHIVNDSVIQTILVLRLSIVVFRCDGLPQEDKYTGRQHEQRQSSEETGMFGVSV